MKLPEKETKGNLERGFMNVLLLVDITEEILGRILGAICEKNREKFTKALERFPQENPVEILERTPGGILQETPERVLKRTLAISERTIVENS